MDKVCATACRVKLLVSYLSDGVGGAGVGELGSLRAVGGQGGDHDGGVVDLGGGSCGNASGDGDT